jgi:hypothetical protein
MGRVAKSATALGSAAMKRVRIVGGGLTGVLAALEAHRLGARHIELHEHLDKLGGQLLPRVEHGLELRDRWVAFGGREDPVRKLLEWRGAAFDETPHRLGSVSPTPKGPPLSTPESSDPILQGRDGSYGRLVGEALTDRLRSYPTEFHAPLTRYCQWRLGVWLDEVHASAAGPLSIEHVRTADRRLDEAPATSLPQGGFAALFQAAHGALEDLGVQLHFDSLVSPREILESDDDAVTVWTPALSPVYAALGKTSPKTIAYPVATYVLQARGAATPFMLQNFTARGGIFRLSLYESRGETLICAECVSEISDEKLRKQIAELTAAFDGDNLKLGDTLMVEVKRRTDCISMDAARKLPGLRTAIAQAKGAAFVVSQGEGWDAGDRFRGIARRLAIALAEDIPDAQAAA